MNNTLGHKEGQAIGHYVDHIASEQQIGAAHWIRNRSRGVMENYKPLKVVPRHSEIKGSETLD